MNCSLVRKALVLLFLLYCVPLEAQAKIRVVSSTLDMADFARHVGGDSVETYGIYNGKYDIHFFEPRPSQVVKLRKADLLIVAGLDGDPWIRPLIDAARNPRIRFGAPGYVDPSIGVRPIQIPTGRIDGAMGDVHPYGNPHFWFSCENALIALDNVCKGLCRVSPENEQLFNERKERYAKEIEATFNELRAKIETLRGTKVVEYHRSWDYFCSEFGLDIVATLEPKPGIPPSPSHLREVVATVKSAGATIMLAEKYYPSRPINFVVRETGVKPLRLPLYVGEKPDITTYLDNLKYNISTIVESLKKLNE